MNYTRGRHLLIAVPLLLFAGFTYGATYRWMRLQHHFVRNATYYTDLDSGRRIRTDSIGLGEWRSGPEWDAAAFAFLPARWAEGQYWRSRPAVPP